MTMRFGVFIPQGWRMDLVGIDPAEHWSTMSGLAQRADSGPWESIWVYNHFHTTPTPIHEATHEAWTLMAAFAASTTRVRLGQMCTCMSYRNPAYLAKVAATVDIVSGGRTEMGIAGGWYEHEWRAYGYGFPPAGERLRALDEGVQIMRQAWTTGSATLQGKTYQVDGAIVRPLPLQPGGIPLWIAGGGEKVTLKIAAKYAQYTNFDGTLDGFRRKSAVLAEHCRSVGRDFGAITRSANCNVAIGATEHEVQERLSRNRDGEQQDPRVRLLVPRSPGGRQERHGQHGERHPDAGRQGAQRQHTVPNERDEEQEVADHHAEPGPLPGQCGAFAGRAVHLDRFGRRSVAGHRGIWVSAYTATPTAAMTTSETSQPSALGAGKGSPLRSARSTLRQDTSAITAMAPPNRQASSATTSRKAGRPASAATEVSAIPPAMSASPVRTQASAVRSLASENRGSGSLPTAYTLRGRRRSARSARGSERLARPAEAGAGRSRSPSVTGPA